MIASATSLSDECGLSQDGDEDAGGLVAAILGMLGMEEGEVKDADTLESLGVDSMQAAEIRSRLQRALGRPIPLEEVRLMTSPGVFLIILKQFEKIGFIVKQPGNGL